MKVILSRKGFDGEWGGYASPILPDGRLLSLPIPAREKEIRSTPAKSKICYGDVRAVKNKTYYDIMSKLKPRGIKRERKWESLTESTQCHLDPDLIASAYPRVRGWKPVFGQAQAAQGHLANECVRLGDLFLFFGRFQDAIFRGDELVFDKGSQPIHAIFGYLQIGRVHAVKPESKVPGWLRYHPHSASEGARALGNNTIYESAEKLSLVPGLPGAGSLKLTELPRKTKTMLTKFRSPLITCWDLPELFREVEISYHKSSTYGWENDHFQCADIGQEFVIEENKKVTAWAKQLINCNYIKKPD